MYLFTKTCRINSGYAITEFSYIKEVFSGVWRILLNDVKQVGIIVFTENDIKDKLNVYTFKYMCYILTTSKNLLLLVLYCVHINILKVYLPTFSRYSILMAPSYILISYACSYDHSNYPFEMLKINYIYLFTKRNLLDAITGEKQFFQTILWINNKRIH